MNKNLVKEITELRKKLYEANVRIVNKYNDSKDADERRDLALESRMIEVKYNDLGSLRDELVELYKQPENENSKKRIAEIETTLNEKYGIGSQKVKKTDVEETKEVKSEEKPMKVVKTEKPSDRPALKGAIAGALAALLTLGVVSCLKGCGNDRSKTQSNKPNKTIVTQSEQQNNKKLFSYFKEHIASKQEEETASEKLEEAVTASFSEYGKMKDVTKDKQVEARAQWYFDTYINKDDGVNRVTVEDIANDIRLYNGEFKEEDGKATYNANDLVAAGIDLHTIANYNSFVQCGNNIHFTPFAPLFEDGSLAQKAAYQLDVKMEAVVKAINANDQVAFKTAATDWGYTVLNMFRYVDYTGEIVNYSQVEDASQFQLYHAMRSKYASTILEYSEKYGIDICLDYCINLQTCETEQISLSELMYSLDEEPLKKNDGVAIRSGHQDDIKDTDLSLPEILLVRAKDYYNSKYDLEIGNSRSLK